MRAGRGIARRWGCRRRPTCYQDSSPGAPGRRANGRSCGTQRGGRRATPLHVRRAHPSLPHAGPRQTTPTPNAALAPQMPPHSACSGRGALTGHGNLRDLQGRCDLCGEDCYPNEEVRTPPPLHSHAFAAAHFVGAAPCCVGGRGQAAAGCCFSGQQQSAQPSGYHGGGSRCSRRSSGSQLPTKQPSSKTRSLIRQHLGPAAYLAARAPAPPFPTCRALRPHSTPPDLRRAFLQLPEVRLRGLPSGMSRKVPKGASPGVVSDRPAPPGRRRCLWPRRGAQRRGACAMPSATPRPWRCNSLHAPLNPHASPLPPSNRKTGFQCPRGYSKSTASGERCRGKIEKSHPIVPRSEKKAIAKASPTAPCCAAPPLRAGQASTLACPDPGTALALVLPPSLPPRAPLSRAGLPPTPPLPPRPRPWPQGRAGPGAAGADQGRG
jgi:hypothetical protein